MRVSSQDPQNSTEAPETRYKAGVWAMQYPFLSPEKHTPFGESVVVLMVASLQGPPSWTPERFGVKPLNNGRILSVGGGRNYSKL